ncbi:MAG: NAD(+)/NADH kinase [Deltaproteobacteria bacterium]|nr:NAD(+)/NADH kinase [Deltaproteobacteria bacterium]
MKINRVLLVYKKSSYQRHALDSKDEHFIRLLRKKNVAFWQSKETHDRHMETLLSVKKDLKALGIRYDVRLRYHLRPLPSYDLVITIGGDGTFLESSHFLRGGLLMGVNSTPTASVGYYCRTQAGNFSEKIRRLREDKAKIKPLHRLQAKVNGRRVGPLSLNDILFTNRSPADTSRYLLKIGPRREEQKSSGIWFSPSPGSTAATLSAGGRKLPLSSTKFQYVVRELYKEEKKRFRLLKGILGSREKAGLISNMKNGALYFDGPHFSYTLKRGDEVTICQALEPIRAVW